jgi:hypothetical protein
MSVDNLVLIASLHRKLDTIRQMMKAFEIIGHHEMQRNLAHVEHVRLLL